MDMGLQDVVVMVTGSSSRIGRATAVAFAREGAKVAVTYHQNQAGGEETAASVKAAGGVPFVVPLDLSDEASITAAVRTVQDTFGAVAVLVNNGVAWPGFPGPGELFETAPAARFRDSLKANLEGHYLLTQAVVGGMREAGWGRVVHVSTGLVEDGLPGVSAYVTAKAGLHGLTRTMSRELARSGILTNLVMPGFTRDVDEGREIPERVRQIEEKAKAATSTGRETYRGVTKPIERRLDGIQSGEVRYFQRRMSIYGHKLYLTSLKRQEDDVLIVSSQNFRDSLAIYAQRWEIETLFSCLKSRGFDMEATHLYYDERVSKLVTFLAIAFAWAHLVGEWLHEQKPIAIKKHGRKAKSFFRYGLDHLRHLLLGGKNNRREFARCFQCLTNATVLSCT